MKVYRHLYFDLDHTLWDFDRNSREVLLLLHEQYRLRDHGIASREFIDKYFEVNAAMWGLFHRGLIDRQTLRGIRFERTFEYFKISNSATSREFPDAYLDLLPTRKNLIPGSVETLKKLGESYSLHLITNGFLEVQQKKLRSSGLLVYFNEVIISESAGSKKPEKAIFDLALRRAGALSEESLMIGDDLEADVQGALHAGWDAVYFNPLRREHASKATYEIHQLADLHSFL